MICSTNTLHVRADKEFFASDLGNLFITSFFDNQITFEPLKKIHITKNL